MTAVESRMTLRLLAPDIHAGTPVTGVFRYQPGQPYAVELTFVGYNGIRWVFARDLLTDGLDGMAGLGDVKVWPGRSKRGPMVCIGLSSPEGRSSFEAHRRTMARFLDRTFAAVPQGAESTHVDVDSWIRRLNALGDLR